MAATIRDDDEMISGINVTPLVDIALVLLIVFLVTAKFIAPSPALPMVAPQSAHGSVVQSPFSLEISADGRVLVGGTPATSDAAIVAAARAASARDPEVRAILRADGSVPHARIIRAIDLLKDGGISRIAFGVAPGQAAPLVPEAR